jgi:hypothetical protein
MQKEDTVLLLILIGCPVAMLATDILIQPMCTILQDEIELFEALSSLTLIIAQACGWLILVRKSGFKSTTRILLYSYVILFSVIVLLLMWTLEAMTAFDA